MPTALTHAAVPLALRAALGPGAIPGRLLAAGIAASIAPDLDAVGFRLGVPYASDLGHRGLTHSLAFALAAGLAGGLAHRLLRARPATAFACLLVAAVSHPLLDALTSGGLGVALLWPWSSARFFAPVRPILVAPLGWRVLLSARGAAVLASELRWVWTPCAALSVPLAAARLRKPFADALFRKRAGRQGRRRRPQEGAAGG